MSRTLREELVDLVGRWRMPPPAPEPKLPTFESVRDHIEIELRKRAKAGCSTYGAHMTTDRFWGGWDCLGNTGDPDKNEEILRQVAAWLSDQGLIVEVSRHDELARVNHYGDEEPGYSSVHIEVRWK